MSRQLQQFALGAGIEQAVGWRWYCGVYVSTIHPGKFRMLGHRVDNFGHLWCWCRI